MDKIIKREDGRIKVYTLSGDFSQDECKIIWCTNCGERYVVPKSIVSVKCPCNNKEII